MLLVCTILLHTIWSRAQWITDNIINKENLNRVGYKVQDLELRVNILTYKMQYGIWPSPTQIKETDIKKQKSNVRLSLSSCDNRDLWLSRCLGDTKLRPRYLSRSENLDVRFRKKRTLVETSRKIYYNRPREIPRFNNLPFQRRRYEELNYTNDKQPIKVEENNLQMTTAETSKNRQLSLINTYITNKDSVVSVIDTTNLKPIDLTLDKLSNNNIEDTTNDKIIISTSSSCHNDIKSTEATLVSVKNQLQSLHTVLKTYGSHGNLQQSDKELVNQELATDFLTELNELCTEADSDGKTIEITSNLVETTEDDCDNHQHRELISSDYEISGQNEKNYSLHSEETDISLPIKNNEEKLRILSETDDDLPSTSPVSSRPEASKGSGSDEKSSETCDTLNLTALLTELGNCTRWNNKSDDDSEEGDTDNVFPKMKSFCQLKLLEIISEEHSGSSCNEKNSRTLIQSKKSTNSMKIDENSPISHEFCEYTNSHLVPPLNIKQTESLNDINKHNEDIEKIFEPLEKSVPNFHNLFNKFNNIPVITHDILTKNSENLIQNSQNIRPWEPLIEYSSEESLQNFSNIQNLPWDSQEEGHIHEKSLDNLFQLMNHENLIDSSNLILKRRPGLFSMSSEASKTQGDSVLSLNNSETDLIDLCNDESDSKIPIIIQNNDLPSQISLIVIGQENLMPEIEIKKESIPLTSRTTIHSLHTSNKIDENDRMDNDDESINTDSCKNSTSRNLIELERITYEELTNAENSWDSEPTAKLSCSELTTLEVVPVLTSRKSPLNLTSTASSLYLTVQGSFSDLSIDESNSISQNQLPEELMKINENNCSIIDEKLSHLMHKNDNEDELTVTSKDSALSETPQASIMTLSKRKSIKDKQIAETSSITSSNDELSYVDANSHNFLYSSGISLSFDKLSTNRSNKSVRCSSTSTIQNVPVKKAKTVNNSTQKYKKEKILPKKEELKMQKTIKPSVRAKSNVNLTRNNSNGRIPDRWANELPQRRSKSYVTPRKYDTSPRQSLTSQNSSKSLLKLPDFTLISSKSSIINRKCNSRIKFDPLKTNSRSRESVVKSGSKSCIPVLKNRREITKKDNLSSQNLTKDSSNPENNSEYQNNTENSQKISENEQKKNPDGQTVIYVNIVTDSENCVTKVVNRKEFLEYVKEDDLNISEMMEKDGDKSFLRNNESPRFFTVVSSTRNNDQLLENHQKREMEVMAKPSVMDTSTSIPNFSDDNKFNIEVPTVEASKELTNVKLITSLDQTENCDKLTRHEINSED